MDNRIEEFLEKMDMSQVDLAKEMGLSKNTINGWIHKRDNISLENLVKFANKYRYSIDYLLCLSDKNTWYTEVKEIDPILIGNNLKKKRDELNLLQNDFSTTCSIHYVTYSNYETGKHTITGYNLYLICKKYKLSIDEILGRKKV